MKTLSALAQNYVDRFDSALENLPGQGDRNIATLRKSGLEKFQQADFPHRRIEDWRPTNLTEMIKGFPLIAANEAREFSETAFNSAFEIVFEDGLFNKAHSKLDDLPTGIKFTTLADELGNGAVFSLPEDENRSLVALNTAFMQDGFCLTVEDEVQLNDLLVIRFKNTASPQGRHLRNRIVMGENSRLNILEIHEGIGHYFTNPVTNISVSKGAELGHFKLQNESHDAYHLALTDTDIHENAIYRNFSLSLGSKLSRNELLSTIVGAGAESHLNGAYLMRDRQHCDTTTVTEHKVPNNISKQTYKGVLDGYSKGVFQGKIHIFENAQKVSGDQLSKTLLLSDNAQVTCKPELEIYADDVKCSHGATSGELDETALFYLESRGISKEHARQMLIEAFLGDVLEEITHETVKEFFTAQATRWLAEA